MLVSNYTKQQNNKIDANYNKDAVTTFQDEVYGDYIVDLNCGFHTCSAITDTGKVYFFSLYTSDISPSGTGKGNPMPTEESSKLQWCNGGRLFK